MHLKTICIIATAVAAFWLSAATPELEWKPGRFGRIAERDGKRFLTVQVPPEAKEAISAEVHSASGFGRGRKMFRFRRVSTTASNSCSIMSMGTGWSIGTISAAWREVSTGRSWSFPRR